jgi:hypothetical protein
MIGKYISFIHLSYLFGLFKFILFKFSYNVMFSSYNFIFWHVPSNLCVCDQ